METAWATIPGAPAQDHALFNTLKTLPIPEETHRRLCRHQNTLPKRPGGALPPWLKQASTRFHPLDTAIPAQSHPQGNLWIIVYYRSACPWPQDTVPGAHANTLPSPLQQALPSGGKEEGEVAERMGQGQGKKGDPANQGTQSCAQRFRFLAPHPQPTRIPKKWSAPQEGSSAPSKEPPEPCPPATASWHWWPTQPCSDSSQAGPGPHISYQLPAATAGHSSCALIQVPPHSSPVGQGHRHMKVGEGIHEGQLETVHEIAVYIHWPAWSLIGECGLCHAEGNLYPVLLDIGFTGVYVGCSTEPRSDLGMALTKATN